jgi:transcriptional regulator with XRE-family HTH domain
MTEVAHHIDLNLPAKLRDKDYRQQFFLAEASSRIAEQIVALRKRRILNQKQLAELTDTKQPAISRVEQADYQNWSFSTLRKIVEALDARIRVVIEASEDVLSEYESHVESDYTPAAAIEFEDASQAASPNLMVNKYANSWSQYAQALAMAGHIFPPQGGAYLNVQLAEKDAEIARLRAENKALKSLATMPSPQEDRLASQFNALPQQARLVWATEALQK